MQRAQVEELIVARIANPQGHVYEVDLSQSALLSPLFCLEGSGSEAMVEVDPETQTLFGRRSDHLPRFGYVVAYRLFAHDMTACLQRGHRRSVVMRAVFHARSGHIRDVQSFGLEHLVHVIVGLHAEPGGRLISPLLVHVTHCHHLGMSTAHIAVCMLVADAAHPDYANFQHFVLLHLYIQILCAITSEFDR